MLGNTSYLVPLASNTVPITESNASIVNRNTIIAVSYMIYRAVFCIVLSYILTQRWITFSLFVESEQRTPKSLHLNTFSLLTFPSKYHFLLHRNSSWLGPSGNVSIIIELQLWLKTPDAVKSSAGEGACGFYIIISSSPWLSQWNCRSVTLVP